MRVTYLNGPERKNLPPSYVVVYKTLSYNSTFIKTPGEDCYSYVHIYPDGTIYFGEEQGNYSGGIVSTNISIEFEYLKNYEPKFYELIMEEFKRIGKEPKLSEENKENINNETA